MTLALSARSAIVQPYHKRIVMRLRESYDKLTNSCWRTHYNGDSELTGAQAAVGLASISLIPTSIQHRIKLSGRRPKSNSAVGRPTKRTAATRKRSHTRERVVGRVGVVLWWALCAHSFPFAFSWFAVLALLLHECSRSSFGLIGSIQWH